jgi:hypothetical protein
MLLTYGIHTLADVIIANPTRGYLSSSFYFIFGGGHNDGAQTNEIFITIDT